MFKLLLFITFALVAQAKIHNFSDLGGVHDKDDLETERANKQLMNDTLNIL